MSDSRFRPSRRRPAARRERVDLHAAADLLEDRVLLSAGTLDPGFGEGGVATTGYLGPVSQDEIPRAVSAQLGDGRTLVVGVTIPFFNPPDFDRTPSPILTRFAADGSPDPTFGNDGVVVLTGLAGFDPRGVAVDAQGRVLLVGSLPDAASDFGVVRIDVGGVLDSSFGVGGVATVDFSGGNDVARSIAVQGDGSVLVVGSTSSAGGSVLAAARLGANGGLDETFGVGGRAVVDLAGGSEFAFGVVTTGGRVVLGVGRGNGVHAAALTAGGHFDTTFGQDGVATADISLGGDHWDRGIGTDAAGRIVLAGTVFGPTGSYDYAAVRLTAGGTVDGAFGTAGRVLVDVAAGSTDQLYGFTVQADGRVVLAGHSDTSDAEGNFARLVSVARLAADGTPDASFGTAGRVTTGLRGSLPWVPVDVAPDGRIVLVTSAVESSSGTRDIKTVRLNSDGTTDKTFGVGGIATTDVALPAAQQDDLTATLRLPDGRILVVGSAGGVTPATPTLTRYLEDGRLDTSFGDGGKRLVTDLQGFASVAGAALAADGRIVLVGAEAGSRIVAARLTADGTLDPTFGNGGVAAVAIGGRRSYAAKVGILEDGRIVIAGGTIDADGFGEDIAVVRLLADGRLDTAFGVGGIAVVDIGGGGDGTGDLAIQADGRIVVVGQAGVAAAADMAAIRLTADGALDPTFGTGGRAVFDLGGTGGSYASAVALLSDGRIVLGGGSGLGSGGQSDMAVVRLTADGRRDLAFGSGGVTLIDFYADGDSLADLAVQQDGRIVIVGNVLSQAEPDSGWLLAIGRLDAQGAVDSTFGMNGRVSVDPGHGSDFGRTVLVRPDGRILAGATLTTAAGGRDLGLISILSGLTAAADRSSVAVLGGQPVSNTGRVLGADPAGVALSASLGTVTLAADGTWLWSYTPAGPRRMETVTVTATAAGETSRVSFRLFVTAPPAAGSDTYRVREEATLAGNILANDADPDGDPLVVSEVNGSAADVGQTISLPSGAKVRLNADGSFDYDPNGAFARLTAGETAVDTFAYSISDGTGGTATTSARVVVYGRGTADLLGYAGGEWHVAASNGSAFTDAVAAAWADAAWDALKTGDFDGDGRTDVLGLLKGEWYVGLARTANSGLTYFSPSPRWGRWNAVAAWEHVLVGDYDGDGRDDVVAEAGGVWYGATSTGSAFVAPQKLAGTSDAAWGLAALADVTGDGKDDLVLVVNGDWYVGVSAGSMFVPAARWARMGAGSYQLLTLTDLNADDKADAVGFIGGEWRTGLSDGSTAFAVGLRAKWANTTWLDPVVGDFDGDGTADLAARYGGQWYVGLSNAAGGEKSRGLWTSWNNLAWKDVRAGDFDGDGRADLAGRYNGDWYVARSTGSGFATSRWGRWNEAAWRAVAAGDADGAVPPASAGASSPSSPTSSASVARVSTTSAAFAAPAEDEPLLRFWSAAEKDEKLAAGLLGAG